MQTNKQTPLFACHFTQQMTHLVCKSSLSYGHHDIAWLRSRVVSFNPNIQKHLQNLLITLQLDQQCPKTFKKCSKLFKIVQIWHFQFWSSKFHGWDVADNDTTSHHCDMELLHMSFVWPVRNVRDVHECTHKCREANSTLTNPVSTLKLRARKTKWSSQPVLWQLATEWRVAVKAGDNYL